jgi:hypothetical protein
MFCVVQICEKDETNPKTNKKQNLKIITTITMVMHLLHNEALNIHGVDYLPFIMEITKAIASFWRRKLCQG